MHTMCTVKLNGFGFIVVRDNGGTNEEAWVSCIGGWRSLRNPSMFSFLYVWCWGRAPGGGGLVTYNEILLLHDPLTLP